MWGTARAPTISWLRHYFSFSFCLLLVVWKCVNVKLWSIYKTRAFKHILQPSEWRWNIHHNPKYIINIILIRTSKLSYIMLFIYIWTFELWCIVDIFIIPSRRYHHHQFLSIFPPHLFVTSVLKVLLFFAWKWSYIKIENFLIIYIYIPYLRKEK